MDVYGDSFETLHVATAPGIYVSILAPPMSFCVEIAPQLEDGAENAVPRRSLVCSKTCLWRRQARIALYLPFLVRIYRYLDNQPREKNLYIA